MIGKIQRLKNKKGFTLVELIVVIAIIAVLAAILVPLMGDYLSKARVSSANSAAASYKMQINAYLTELSMNGKGRIASKGLAAYVISVGSGGGHGITNTTAVTGISADGTTEWEGSTIGMTAAALVTQLNTNITDVKNANVLVILNGNTCKTVLFSPSNALTANLANYVTSAGLSSVPSDGMSSDGVIGVK